MLAPAAAKNGILGDLRLKFHTVCFVSANVLVTFGEPTSFYTNLDSIFQQGAMEGKSIFVATGDLGTAAPKLGSCVVPPKPPTANIEENAGSPHVTAVGASMFQATYDDDGRCAEQREDAVARRLHDVAVVATHRLDHQLQRGSIIARASSGSSSSISSVEPLMSANSAVTVTPPSSPEFSSIGPGLKSPGAVQSHRPYSVRV